MPYTGTNALSQLDATKPLGSEGPEVIDDALRETRLVFKTLLGKTLTDTGSLRSAIWGHRLTSTLAVGSGSSTGVWARRPCTIIEDATSLLSAGTYTNSIKPIAGTYLVQFFAFGYKLDDTQVRFAEATSNGVSAGISKAYGNVAFSNNGGSYASVTSQGMAILTFDGIKSYALEQIHAVNNTTNGWGYTATASGDQLVAGVTFTLLTKP